MPLSLNTTTSGGTDLTQPFVGPVDHTHHVKVDLSGLTLSEVTADGYLRPGVPFRVSSGLAVLISGSGQVCDGVSVGTQRLNVTTPATNTTLGNETGDHFITVATHCVMNRDIVEDNLARALSADEISSLDYAFITLTST